MDYFYITTTLPYVNADPHIGFAMELIRADAVARYKELMGYNVFFNTGTDEHGVKIYEKANEAGEDIQNFVDNKAERFKDLVNVLGIKEDAAFIRTTNTDHEEAAKELWRRCRDNGYIDKKMYQTKYCRGCELEKTDSDLEDGRCPEHPDRELEYREEENYFFKFSAFQKDLLRLYEDNPEFVVPDFRLREIQLFVERGLEDFSISRLKEKMPWGVPVPDDPDHVMYVWFDALTNYISTLGWPENEQDVTAEYQLYWVHGSPTQYAGKDNLRQQAAMWQAMLIAAGLPTSNQVVINGFINVNGQKMSKSLGNVIDPYMLIDEYKELTPFPEEIVRYYLLRHVSPFEDSDMTLGKVAEVYNSHLANGLGNIVSRVMNMIEKYEVDISHVTFEYHDAISYHSQHMDRFELNLAMDEVWRLVGDLDLFIAENQPFKTIKEDPNQAHKDLKYCATELARVAVSLRPFMPKTADTIEGLLSEGKKPEQPLFKRKEVEPNQN